jgi:Ser/Thr protein kinase RdoA (MazF antagonist)
VRRLVTTYSTLDWSDDGTVVAKVRPPAPDARRRFRNELRVNRMLVERPPPVPTARLVGHDVQHRRLAFEAVAGEPLGPKYPHRLTTGQVEALVDLAGRLDGYQPRRQWFRRVDPVRRLRLARRAGLLDDADLEALSPRAHRLRGRLRFAHGDLTARNVLAGGVGAAGGVGGTGGPGGDAGPTLIDWEWAGLHPPGYDLAFLWYSLVELPDARARVERHALATPGVDEPTFLLGALLVELWHLHWYLPPGHRLRHEATRDELLARLGKGAGTAGGPAPPRGEAVREG